MNRIKKVMMLMILMISMTLCLSGMSFAVGIDNVRDFPGNNGSGMRLISAAPQKNSPDSWGSSNNDDRFNGPGAGGFKRGWRYSPAGWWFQYSNGNWPSNGWFSIDGRWYLFDGGGHMMTGWYTDPGGNRFYLNPVDDGTLGSMRIGWQLIGGKAYYFNTMSDGFLGRLLTNTTTPDGYRVGADGVMVN